MAYLATVTAVLPDGMTYSGSTAGNGSFSIGSLPPGSYTLAARLFPNAPATASVTLAAGQTLAAGTLTLGSPSTVTGLVKDSAGTGLTGVTVQITGQPGTTTTDGMGRFSLSCSAGSWTATASASFIVTSTSSTFSVPEGQTVDIGVLTVERRTTVSGTVTDGDTGALLQGVTVAVQGQGLSAVTNSSGYFQIADVVGNNATFVFTKTGYVSRQRTETLDGGSQSIGATALFAGSGTYVQGRLTANTTWAAAQSPYYIDSVEVAAGVTLTIEPGVTIKALSGASLTVLGDVLVQGTSSQPVVFRSALASPSTSSWSGIVLNSPQPSDLRYFEVQNAYAAIQIFDGAHILDHGTF
ncbi:MAG: carboxypeptidase regulatory-like domain-containing protein, partial [Acidobacteria bacterium]|nr:carboxypeptidase regulatory-like domain-containing protein [Acidobacteriota bacterium]